MILRAGGMHAAVPTAKPPAQHTHSLHKSNKLGGLMQGVPVLLPLVCLQNRNALNTHTHPHFPAPEVASEESISFTVPGKRVSCLSLFNILLRPPYFI